MICIFKVFSTLSGVRLLSCNFFITVKYSLH